MLFSEAVFVGVDPTAGESPMCYAALDANLRLLALDHDDMQGVLAFVGGLDSAIVGINAPQTPNKGLLREEQTRRRYNLMPDGRTWRKWRVCEFELRKRNIHLYNTPEKEQDSPGWVQAGFELHRRVRSMRFFPLAKGEPSKTRGMIETNPHACYTALLERRPFPKGTLEGRLQRQLVLYLEGLDLANPMHALEEVTRHHLLTGHLPLEQLHEHEQLDAIVAAFTAYLYGSRPERVCQVGADEEGWITLPVAELKDFYH
jgi:predicted nuclease with RNAse H fold